MRVLLHFDGGIGVGLGHMSRCIALAIQMRRVGHEVFILIDPTSGLSSFTQSHEFKTFEISINPSSVVNLANQLNIDCLIVDSYKWFATNFTDVKGKWLVVVFDDDATRNLSVDALINGSLTAKKLNYIPSSTTELWVGPQYQIVKEFFSALPRRKINSNVSRVVVMFGGGDSNKLLSSIQNVFHELAVNNGFVVDIICGPFTSGVNKLESKHLNVLINPSDLCQRMATADLAVSASGQTLYELSRCGTPTIAFCTANNQIHNLAAFSKVEAVINAGNCTDPDWIKKITHAVQLLADDHALRISMSKVGQTLIDGLGAERLVEKIEALVYKANSNKLNYI